MSVFSIMGYRGFLGPPRPWPPIRSRARLCISGMYDMKRCGSRRAAATRSDATEGSMSTIRHRGQLHAPITVAYGRFATPEFQRQDRDFAAAVKAAGKYVTLVQGKNCAHTEVGESLANLYAPRGRVALA